MNELFENRDKNHVSKLFEKYSDRIDAVAKAKPDLNKMQAYNLAQTLANTEKFFEKRSRKLNEATQAGDVGTFRKYALDLVTAVMPNLQAEDIVTVQSLPRKVGQIFYIKYVYGSDKGQVEKGDTLWSPFEMAPNEYDHLNYSSETIDQEILSDGSDTNIKGNLGYVPVRPGTIVIDVGGYELTDDGDGNITGPNVDEGEIDYSSGEYDITFDSAPNTDVVADYEYNLEHAPSTIPQVDTKVDEITVTARPRKLRTLMGFDAIYDFEMEHGEDLEDMVMEAAGSELVHAIDGEIMLDLFRQAGGTTTWEKAIPSPELSQHDHFRSFLNEITSTSNDIFQRTKRAVGNFIICGKKAGTVLQSVAGQRLQVSAGRQNEGPHKLGVLDGQWDVYKNPFYNEDWYLIGYKGGLEFEAGYVYAPYLPFFSTDSIMLDDFVSRRGYATSYGKRMLNNKVYVAGTITQDEDFYLTT